MLFQGAFGAVGVWVRPAGCSFTLGGMGGSVGTRWVELGVLCPYRAPDGRLVSGSVGGMDRTASVVRGRLAAVGV